MQNTFPYRDGSRAHVARVAETFTSKGPRYAMARTRPDWAGLAWGTVRAGAYALAAFVLAFSVVSLFIA